MEVPFATGPKHRRENALAEDKKKAIWAPVDAELFGSTERFDIFRVRVVRDVFTGLPRDVYMAWHHSEDVPKPVCTVTLNGHIPYGGQQFEVDWIHVDECCRREGIATEVMLFLISHLPNVTYQGVSEEGDALCDKLDRLLEDKS